MSRWRRGDATAGRDHHGQPLRLGDDVGRARYAGRAGDSLRDARRFGAPHARRDVRIRASRRRSAGLQAIIAGAGGAAHLPGHDGREDARAGDRRAGGNRSALSGLDSLLSIVQMPPGVPVATMAIGGAVNAALFAARIVALRDAGVAAAARRLRRAHARRGRIQQLDVNAIDTIGMIGGGQLGRMFALDAKRMGYRRRHARSARAFAERTSRRRADRRRLRRYRGDRALGRRTDVVTYEFENIAIASVRASRDARVPRHARAATCCASRKTACSKSEFVRECRSSRPRDFAAMQSLDDLSQRRR